MDKPRATVVQETVWLAQHPEFEQRPAMMEEFLGVGYLDIYSGIRTGVREFLIDIFDLDGKVHSHGDRIARVERAIFTGGIGTGKTTMASIALLYMVHWVLCLKDPQKYYDLLPGSRIAFMMMSTSEQQAREVIFGDISARMKHSEWFTKNARRDPKFTKQIRFPEKNVWIIPGDSRETSFEGYNILGGVLEEADSHKQTREKDYAEDGYNTIVNRIKSRYVDNSNPSREGHKGLIIVIGQMKRQGGFVSDKYEEFKEDKYSHAKRMTVWESFGWDKYLKADGKRNSFWYDIKRKIILPDGAGAMLDAASAPDNLIEIPRNYLQEFKNKPEKALRDLAGIPPYSSDPFIGMFHKIAECEERYAENHPDKPNGYVNESCVNPQFDEDLICSNSLKYAGHIDLAYSSEGDAASIVLGHVSHLSENEDGEMAPYIVLDIIIRVRARPGREVMLSDLRQYIYELKDVYKFKIYKITLDGFQSVDTIQQLRRRKIQADYLSVDKSKEPYEDLREAIYENRLEFPKYLTYRNPGDTDVTDILMKELLELTDTGPKIDHPRSGSKDIADGCAAVVHKLMNDNTYRKGLSYRSENQDSQASVDSIDKMFEGFGKSPFSGSNDGRSGIGSLQIHPSILNPGTDFRLPPRFYK